MDFSQIDDRGNYSKENEIMKPSKRDETKSLDQRVRIVGEQLTTLPIAARWAVNQLRTSSVLALMFALSVACGSDKPQLDAGPVADAGPVVDAGPDEMDAGPVADAGPVVDAGPDEMDAGPELDAGPQAPTWVDDIGPLFATKCTSCHRAWAGTYSGVLTKITNGSLLTRTLARHKMLEADALMVLAWLDAGYPEN